MLLDYKIKQLPHGTPYKFYWYDLAVKTGFNPKDISDYIEVYSGQVKKKKTVEDTLEELFMLFNLNHPKDYKSHSLSVSDIIELDGINYFVDGCGFKPLTEVEVM